MRIAVVEDNMMLADGIARAFERDGHGVDQLHNGADAVDFLKQEAIDLVILDVNLPGKSGLEVLAELRKARKQVPVLILTARGSLDDKVAGLDHGADDYLTKPFELEELQARARALLRRSEKAMTDALSCGDLELISGSLQISRAGFVIDLPRREFALAELLMRRAGQVISKQQIIEHLYGSGSDVEDGAAELYISRLRKKLDRSGVEIKTLRGLGYCLREVVSGTLPELP